MVLLVLLVLVVLLGPFTLVNFITDADNCAISPLNSDIQRRYDVPGYVCTKSPQILLYDTYSQTLISVAFGAPGPCIQPASTSGLHYLGLRTLWIFKYARSFPAASLQSAR